MKFLSIVSLACLVLPTFGMIDGKLNVQNENVNVKDEILSYSYQDTAPLYSSLDAEEVPDNYIVVFKDNVNIMESTKHTTWLLSLLQTSSTTEPEEKINHIFDLRSEFRGYSGKFTKDTIEKIRTSEDVSVKI